MKKLFALFILLLLIVNSLSAQKKSLDHSVYDTWKSVGTAVMSKEGKFSLFVVSAQAADGYLQQSNLLTGSSFTIDRGKTPTFTFDGKYAVCAISPLYEETRQAKIKKKKPEDMPKDSLCIWEPGKSILTKYPFISSFKTAEEGSLAVAFATEPPPDTTIKTKAPKKEKGEGANLMLYYFKTGTIDTLRHISEYSFNKEGTQLFFVRKLNSKDSSDVQDGLYRYHLVTKTEEALLTGPRKSRFFLPVSDKDELFYAFYANTDTAKTSEKIINIYFFTKGDPQASLVADSDIKGLPKDWIISQNRPLSINKTGTRLFFGIAPKPLEKDTTLIDFETAKLDVWHYLDDFVQPVQLNRLQQDQRTSYLSYIQLQNPENGLIQLATPDYPNVQVPDEWSSDHAYSSTDTPYRIQSQWDTDAPNDLYLIDLSDGNAQKVLTAATISNFSASPQGKYLCWYNKTDRAWFGMETSTGTIRNLTQNIPVAFWDETHDSPSLPSAYGSGGWREGDASFLVYDKYDIWEVDPAGVNPPVMLTNGEGRKQQVTFRIQRLDETSAAPGARMQRASEPIKSNETLFFSAFDHVNKFGGFYCKEQNKKSAQVQRLILDGFTYQQLQRSKDGKVFTFARNNFTQSPNIWMTRDLFKKVTQLSNINPQQNEYKWGTAELVHWTSANDIPCAGILYKPEDFDPDKKYPMIIYFYETLSDGLYTYKAPAPSASTVNISYFVSNDYLVFTPDIHYTIGHPGQSAMNCILPGVEMLCQYPWVDQENMAIQGQSWGGYQVAYMVTQTNRFKAAGAGAPVANMTSAYGGIRWGSGLVRQFQYEGTQSRIGQNLWDGFDLYIENSPLFHAQNVTTPLLIMHNDKDGAVPWYQGIELFTALRRLGKPVWMLQYNDEDHNLVERRNRKDLSIRLAQFFDHFLKGAPAPVWIKEGVPATKKGIDWGLETP
ncbi:MAG: prolyl oligopeptidase family serine peptidase [Prevotellaceae bacterium]|jgi:dipeptidyl aminopeptidase/acylaminoacyl peptidase|nr:prolyl oligopeptidase family serine peptidase [Prevotellaceae bacterium]